MSQSVMPTDSSYRTFSSGVGLLVSVRSVAEATVIADLPVAVIDFKEPDRGPLAAADAAIWHAAADSLGGGRHLSAALGECDEAITAAAGVPSGFRFAKAGPAGTSLPQLIDAWKRLRDSIGVSRLVAVAYADQQAAQCPSPEAIFDAAADLGLTTWLVDTFDKQNCADSIEQLGIPRLQKISESAAAAADAGWVLAGSIRLERACGLLDAGVRPAMFGVRGDVCEGSRRGGIVRGRVERWLVELDRFSDRVDECDDHRRSNAQA